MKARVTTRYNEAIAIERGPLVYALKIAETWTRVNADKPHRELPHGDFEVRPASPWNYGLVVDEAHPDQSVRFEERPVGVQPFSPDGAGMAAKATGRPQVRVITLPKSTDAGSPDFRLCNGVDRIVGYSEAKKPASAGRPAGRAEPAQVTRAGPTGGAL
jgi:hypothetical protein